MAEPPVFSLECPRGGSLGGGGGTDSENSAPATRCLDACSMTACARQPVPWPAGTRVVHSAAHMSPGTTSAPVLAEKAVAAQCQSHDGHTCSHLDVDAAWEQVMWNVFSHCSASVDAGACSHIRPASHRSHAAELPLPLAGVPCRPRTQQRSTERLPSPAVHCAAGARDTSECQLELALRVRSEPSPRALERLTRLSVAVQAIARAGASAGPERQAFIPRLLVTNTTRRLPQATVEVAARCVLRALRVHF